MSLHTLILYILLLTLPFSAALDCYVQPRDIPLPRLDHCYDLIRAINFASQLPHRNNPKMWGRGLPSSAHTEGLPKTYVYSPAGQPPQSCSLDLDADPLDLQAREIFRLQAVATAAARIVNTCLARRGQIGRDTLGETGRVYAKIIRSESPVLLQVGRVDSLTIPGLGVLSWVNKAKGRLLDDA